MTSGAQAPASALAAASQHRLEKQQTETHTPGTTEIVFELELEVMTANYMLALYFQIAFLTAVTHYSSYPTWPKNLAKGTISQHGRQLSNQKQYPC